jgi:hypothetical protein
MNDNQCVMRITSGPAYSNLLPSSALTSIYPEQRLAENNEEEVGIFIIITIHYQLTNGPHYYV